MHNSLTTVLRGNLVPLRGVPETRDSIADVALMTDLIYCHCGTDCDVAC